MARRGADQRTLLMSSPVCLIVRLSVLVSASVRFAGSGLDHGLTQALYPTPSPDAAVTVVGQSRRPLLVCLFTPITVYLHRWCSLTR